MAKPKVSQKDRVNFTDVIKSDNHVTEMAVQLLQLMIQTNTSNPPGNENVLAEKLDAWIQDQGFDCVNTQIIETAPTRANLIVDILGTEPESNPSWGFMSHLDVVPADGKWDHPPFSGEIVQAPHDQFIWGRGAIDIKNLGTANLTALFTLLKEGFRPKGNLKILLCADEEQGGHIGLDRLIQDHFDAVKVDCCLNEGGGFKSPLKNDFHIQIGEKGIYWTGLKLHGAGGHGSTPPSYETFAIYKMIHALENLKEYKPKITIGPEFTMLLNDISLPGIAKWLLQRRSIIRPLLRLAGKIAGFNFNQIIIPLIADSIAPTNFHSGMKENCISPDAEIILDIRTLPGHNRDSTNAMIRQALGKKYFDQMEILEIDNQQATTSPINNPYYEAIRSVIQDLYPGANLVPMLSAGSTDSKFFRQKGILAYGFSPILKDEDVPYAEMMRLAHNANERISKTNLLFQIDFAYRMMKNV